MENSILLMILLQVFLILLNAVFASAEIAVISINDAKLARMVAEGDKRAVRLARLTSQPARFLATIQVAITLSGFLGSAFAADHFSDRLVALLLRAGVPIPEKTLDTLSVILITLLVMVIVYMSFSLLMAILWSLLQSPDLAITEAAVGAGITSILFFLTLRRIGQSRYGHIVFPL